MRILITGSRSWDAPTAIALALTQYLPGVHTLVSGACSKGADRMAEEFAEGVGWAVERHPADWENDGRDAGFIRNRLMVSLGADVCVAFIRDGSKGASHTAKLAEKAGIPTVRITA